MIIYVVYQQGRRVADFASEWDAVDLAEMRDGAEVVAEEVEDDYFPD